MPDRESAPADPTTGHSTGHPADPTTDARSTAAWLPMVASCTVHLVLLLIAAAVLTGQNDGTGSPPDRPVGVAIVHRMADRDRYAEATPRDVAAEAARSASLAAEAARPSDLQPAIDLDGVLASLTEIPSGVGRDAGDGLMGDVGAGEGGATDASASPSGTPGDQPAAVVFGVSGSGSRFVYVFDRSDSMNGYGGKPLRAAKRELIRSISSLTDRQQFAIIFYNERPTPFGSGVGPSAMMFAEPAMVTTAERYIQGISAYGGTQHVAAIEMALRMAPDVIFFLTDAAVPSPSPTEMRQIRDRAQSVGTTIHTIEFGSDASSSPRGFLRQLAEDNGGQYRYLDVQDL